MGFGLHRANHRPFSLFPSLPSVTSFVITGFPLDYCLVSVHPVPARLFMFPYNQYELIDFGDGRKLESFGPVVLDRPAPAAQDLPRRIQSRWKQADFVFGGGTRSKSQWKSKTAVSQPGTITDGRITWDLKLAEFGHVGVFPEQASNWDWIVQQVRRAQRPLRVLNLFAYTGGSTLAAAWAGAEVVHVDSAKNTVAWARRNAKLSGLADRPIHWIVEDAVKFVRREVRRQNFYDAVILDPPSYGHGPKNETWKLSRDLLPLLTQCAQLTKPVRAFVLLTCHSTGLESAELEANLADSFFGSCGTGARAKPLYLRTSAGRRLRAGVVARYPG